MKNETRIRKALNEMLRTGDRLALAARRAEQARDKFIELTVKATPSNASEWEWGAHTGSKQHLFPKGGVCVRSKCTTAYSGDHGVFLNSRRKKCKYCLKLELANP